MTRIQQPKVIDCVRKFLAANHTPGAPLLVGVSGGPDSRALFCTLHFLRGEHGARLHVVHVDHRWRPESGRERAALEQWVADFDGAVFHPCVVNQVRRSEAGARRQRLAIFKRLLTELECQAVLLAHHADDQAETVFKRVYDGASLAKLAGLRPVHRVYGLPIWRPLLLCTKLELWDWLQVREMPAFDDPTNRAEYCLRGRLRDHVFPVIRHQLGGPPALAAIGAEALELEGYLDQIVRPLLVKAVHGPWGVWLDASEARSWHQFLQAALVRSFCDTVSITLSRDNVQKARALLQNGGVGVVSRAGQELHVDRGRLFLSALPVFSPQSGHPSTKGGWKALWRGRATCWVPDQAYELLLPTPGMRYPGNRSLGRWYNQTRVPRFLRSCVPVVIQAGRIVGEFLSGQEGSKNMGAADMISIGVGAAPGALQTSR